MISVSQHVPSRSHGFAGIAFLIVFLVCTSVVSASSIVPTTQQTINPGIIVLKPTLTIEPVYRITTNPTATPTVTPTVQTTICTAPSECLSESEATFKWGGSGFTQTAELPCSYSASAVAAPLIKYCYKQKTVIPEPVITLEPHTLTTPVTVETYETLVETVTPTEVVTVPSLSVVTRSTMDPGSLILNPCPGQEQCNGACIDTKGSDKNNCGGCGWTCSPGLICNQGECIASCPTGFVSCQGADCTDVRNDNRNCGSCGNSCSNRETCMQGKCTSLCTIKPSHFQSFSWADWQGINWMTPAKDQAACGSCWAEASTGATEALYNIEGNFRFPYGYNLNLSEQALVSGCYGDLGSCTGGNHEDALGVLKSKGVAEDIYLPYQSLDCVHENNDGNTVCNANIVGHCSIPGTCTLPTVPANRIWKIQSYTRETDDYAWTNSDEIDTIQQSILCHGPLTACSGNWWHCVDIVGWQGYSWDANGRWIIRNSWGTGWGTNGYGVLQYGFPLSNDKNSQLYGDIAMDAWSVQGVYHG